MFKANAKYLKTKIKPYTAKFTRVTVLLNIIHSGIGVLHNIPVKSIRSDAARVSQGLYPRELNVWFSHASIESARKLSPCLRSYEYKHSL